MAAPVALTGATGFIGRQIATRLAAAGHPVRALARRPQPSHPGITWIPGHLADLSALARLVDGTTAVIHCAGAVRGATEDHFTRVNVHGTRAVSSATLGSHPVPKFLLISSLAAREPALSWYAASKRAAEQVVESERALPWTIFRPPAVYGPGDREILPLFRAMRRGWMPVAAPAAARFSLLHVEDLAAAVGIWLAGTSKHEMCELDDGTPGGYDWTTVQAQATQAWGRPIRRVPVPLSLLRGAAWANVVLSQLIGRAPMLTPGKVRELSHLDWVCDNARLMREAGWQPTIKLADALARPALAGL